MQSVGSRLTAAVTLPLVAVGGAAIKAAADFEDAFAGVAKTVDGVANRKGELTAFGQELKQQFRELAKTIPVSVNELSKIGETAGAMGIPKDKILQFTEVMAKLGATTNLTSDQAASSIGKIQNVYQAAGVDTDRFAASLVALGNAGASTESQILDFAERMGGAAVQADISQAEVLGWSNAMASVGLNAELGSTAWNKVVGEIGKAVDLGSAKLQMFADVSGMTAAAFKNLFKSDASEAVNRLVEGFGRIKASGGNLTAVMQDMGFKTSGIQMTFKNLAASGDMLRKSLDLGKQAWQDNVAMEEEFTKKSATTISQLKVLYNRLYDVGISLGEQLIPAFKRLMPAIEMVLSGLVALVRGFSQLPSGVQAVAIGFVAMVAAIGPVTYAVGTLMTASAALLTLFRTLGASTVFHTALQTLTPVAMGARMAIGSLYAVAAAHPFVAITAAIGGMLFALDKLREAVPNVMNAFKQGGWRAVLGELGRNVNDDDASFFKEWRVDQQRLPGAVKGHDVELLPEPTQAVTQALNNQLASFGGGGKKTKTDAQKALEAWNKELDKLSGREAIKVAEEWLKKVDAIGGVTKMSAAHQEQYNHALGDALDAMQRLNGTVDPRMVDEWFKSFRGPGLIPLTSLPGTDVGRPQIPVPSLDVAPLTSLPGTNVGMPQIPKAPGLGEHLSLAFGSATEFGRNVAAAILHGMRDGLKGIASSIGSLLGGTLFEGIGSKLAASFGDKGLKGFLGSALGAILPGIGSMLGSLLGPALDKLFDRNKGRDLVKDFAASMGGFDALQKQLEALGAEGAELWKQLTQGVGRNNPEQAKAAIDAVTAALARQEEQIKKTAEGIKTFISGATTRIQAFVNAFKGQDGTLSLAAGGNALGGDAGSLQEEFSRMALYAGTAFAQALKQSGWVDALKEVGPAFDNLLQLQQQFGFQLEGSTAQFMAFYQTAKANEDVLMALDGLTQMIKGSTDALFINQELFSAFSNDAVTQYTRMMERGMAANQALVFMQPTLQGLWEAQQKFGFETDAATQALIDQAVQQGIVGANMKDVNQKILDVLILIGDALGAQIPNALRGLPPVAEEAADGVRNALNKIPRNIDIDVNGPRLGVTDPNPPGTGETTGGIPVPQMAYGGIVRARHGGTLVNVGEGGRDEAIIPLGGRKLAGAGTRELVLTIDGDEFARVVVPLITGEAQRLGVS
jgi:TP901 family phage tail tape measure protein